MNKKPLGLYIHIPFCKQKCNYCDFNSSANFIANKEDYIKSLCNEINSCIEDGIALEGNYSLDINLEKYYISTIYIGGGTPSIIDKEDIANITSSLDKVFDLSTLVEFSIEANPESVTLDKVKAWKNLGINRVSMGAQSDNDNLLKTLGRIHSSDDIYKSYEMLLKGGIENINIDLMYGIPGQTVRDLESTLNNIINLDIKHISLYELIIESNTKFYNKYNGYKNDQIDEMDKLISQVIGTSDYNQYEISNYSMENYECKHNINYWENGDYLGVGLSASSHIGFDRFRNNDKFSKYLQNQNKILERNQDINKDIEETIFMGLRMNKGINKNNFFNKYNKNINELYEEKINRFKTLGLMEEDENNIFLTQKGIMYSNNILSEFIN